MESTLNQNKSYNLRTKLSRSYVHDRNQYSKLTRISVTILLNPKGTRIEMKKKNTTQGLYSFGAREDIFFTPACQSQLKSVYLMSKINYVFSCAARAVLILINYIAVR